jgi:hypothetical protein
MQNGTQPLMFLSFIYQNIKFLQHAQWNPPLNVPQFHIFTINN